MKKLALLPSKDEDDTGLFAEYKRTRSLDIREELIYKHLPIVENIVKRFSRRRKDLEDILQVGYVGLIKAVDNYDPFKEVKFSTYATHQVFGEIRHYLRDKTNTIRKPRWIKELNLKISKAIEFLAQENKRLPSIKEVSEYLNITQEGIIEVFKLNDSFFVTSLDIDDGVLFKKIRSQRYISFQLPVEDRIILSQAIEKLKIIEKKAVYLFFYYDLTQIEIGKKLGMSQRKVSRVISRGLSKLKEILTKELW